jgi:hypothetical protein
MPFTLTHTLAAVPASRFRWLSPAGVAIGSMLPDLSLFFPGTPSYLITHSLLLGPLVCLPYGILAVVLFRLCRGPLIAFAPLDARRRLAPYAHSHIVLTLASVTSLVVSLWIGVLSHIVWDGFTHAGRFGAGLVPALWEPWVVIHGHTLSGFETLQHGSSLVGLPLIGVILIRLYFGHERSSVAVPAASAGLRVLGLILGCALVSLASMVALVDAIETPGYFWRNLAYFGVTRVLPAQLTVLLLMALFQRMLGGRPAALVRAADD